MHPVYDPLPGPYTPVRGLQSVPLKPQSVYIRILIRFLASEPRSTAGPLFRS